MGTFMLRHENRMASPGGITNRNGCESSWMSIRLEPRQQGTEILCPEADGDSIDPVKGDKSIVGGVPSSLAGAVVQAKSSGDCQVISHWIAAIPDWQQQASISRLATN